MSQEPQTNSPLRAQQNEESPTGTQATLDDIPPRPDVDLKTVDESQHHSVSDWQTALTQLKQRHEGWVQNAQGISSIANTPRSSSSAMTQRAHDTPKPSPKKPRHNRGAWSANEDDYLLHLVSLHGPHNWVRISTSLGTRSPKQCRERFHQELKPSINYDPITSEEGIYIEQMVAKIGKRWHEIAGHLQFRSDNAVKGWWVANCMPRTSRWDVQRQSQQQAIPQLPPVSNPGSSHGFDHLPDVDHGPISHEEGIFIEQMVDKDGMCWSEIARQLHRRNEIAVKSWWLAKNVLRAPDQAVQQRAEHQTVPPLASMIATDSSHGTENVPGDEQRARDRWYQLQAESSPASSRLAIPSAETHGQSLAPFEPLPPRAERLPSIHQLTSSLAELAEAAMKETPRTGSHILSPEV